MKDYTIKENEKSQYIIDFWKENDGTISVRFADGTVFTKIAYSEENLAKIEAMQEQQAETGIARYKRFTGEKSRDKAKTICAGSITGVMYAFGASSMLIPVMQNLQTAQLAPLALGVGTVALLGTIANAYELKRSSGKVKELDKIKYRNKHRDELDSANGYHNAFAGMNANTARYFKKEQHPYSILNIDCFTQDELETIVKNMATEDATGFAYVATEKEARSK